MIDLFLTAQLALPNVICYEQLKDGQIRDLSHLCGKSTPPNSTVNDASVTPFETLPPNNRSLDSNEPDDPPEEDEE
ncbi:hypothetical protein ACKFKG_20470 [Phormidesmis sp. 146-35]